MKNRIFRKSISFDCKIKALTQKLFYILFSLQTISRLRHAERERRESRKPSTSRNQTHWWDHTTWSLSLLDRSRPPLGQIISSFGLISSSATRWSISSSRSILSPICFLSLIFIFFFCGGVGGGDLVVSVLCGGGFPLKPQKTPFCGDELPKKVLSTLEVKTPHGFVLHQGTTPPPLTYKH